MWIIGRGRLGENLKDYLKEIFNDVDNSYVKTIKDTHTVQDLTKQINELTIIKSQIEEKYQKREREIEHKLGLERQRQEQELKLSTREVTVKIREENLVEDRKRFEEQLKFATDRMAQETGYLKDMIKPLLEALPKMKISQRVK